MPRKKPFSGKQKKIQLQIKKHGKDDDEDQDNLLPSSSHKTKSTKDRGGEGGGPFKLFESRPAPSRMNPGRYALTFRTETREEVEKLKAAARKVYRAVAEEYLECSSGDFFTSLEFPTRPPWSYDISKQQLEKNEQLYFQKYLENVDANFDTADLSYFELNLETWRQFWRVLEMSDILLCVVDMRYPALLFPPKLYEYIRGVGKEMILILNKVDLCPPSVVLAWMDYFSSTYQGMHVLPFTSYPSYNLHSEGATVGGLIKGKRVRGRTHMAAEGAMEVYKICESIVQGKVDLSKWRNKISEEMNHSSEEGENDLKIECDQDQMGKVDDADFYEFKPYAEGILTIGCVGQPNVGKSSLINALMGKKVVSVSKTPGHTKHFQTIFLTQNVRLCDCPGLIFPSKVPKPLQVLAGSYPISQLREPYSSVQYLGQRVNLPAILGIQHPEGKDETEWSALDVSDGWALKRGYYTAKAARLDSYRGANHILRMALEGRICLYLRPPGYTARKDEYSKDPRVDEIMKIQARSGKGKSGYILEASPDLQDSDEGEDESDESTNEEEAGEKTKQGGLKVANTKFSMLNDLEDDDE